MKRLAGVVCAVALAASVEAEPKVDLDTSFGMAFQFDQIASTREELSTAATTGLLDLVATLSMSGDRQYGADIANFRDGGNFFDNYILMEEGYSRLRLDPLTFTAGRSYQREIFTSPYSLFLNSAGHSANGMVLRYEGDWFTYESRWIELNQGSDFGDPGKTPQAWRDADGAGGEGTGFPDRGANLKTFVFRFGSMRFGVQDAGVYTGRSFDLEYFVSPVPEYFTQYFKTTSGRPWTTSGNENNLIGAFWDWVEPEWSLGAQVLMDDFSLHFLLPAQVPDNPWKAAWTLGGKRQTPWGWFGLYHAGALKYTFAPITTNLGRESTSAYGYTYYPSNEYYAGGEFRSLGIETNALGYQHGENNLALMATWSREFEGGFEAASSLEFVLAGANSPTNAWHDATRSNEVGTHWIDDALLEKTLVWDSNLKWLVGDWEFFVRTKLGFKANVLKLSQAVVTDRDENKASSLDRYEAIWRPSSSHEGILALVVGFTWSWGTEARP